jgi:hypothetical protein
MADENELRRELARTRERIKQLKDSSSFARSCARLGAEGPVSE